MSSITDNLEPFQLLRPSAAAELLAISTAQLHALALHGDISYVNVGIGGKRESRRYRLADIQAFIDSRTATGNVKWSKRQPLETTDQDVLKAAKIVARDRKRKERDIQQAAFQEARRQKREASEARRKEYEKEATLIRERLYLEKIFGKGKVPTSMLQGSGWPVVDAEVSLD
jgi:hypothetical protein